MNDVHVSGIGAITAIGDFTRRDGWTKARPFSPRRDDFSLSDYLNTPKTYLDRASALSLAACALALRDAGIETVDGENSGITLGTRAGCLDTMRAFWDALSEKGARLAPPLLFSHSMLNAPTSLCAIEWNLQGPHGTFCAGEHGALEAVRAAHDALQLNRARLMLAVGVEAQTGAHDALQGEEGKPTRSEAAVAFVLQPGARELQLSNERLAEAETRLQEARATFGDCGGALSGLALLKALEED